MRVLALGTALAIVCLASSPSVVLAKGSGGGHGGGGHSGGHSSGGHASGGRGGGHAQGTSTSRARAISRGTSTTPATSASQPQPSRSRDGRPIVGTAVPRIGTTSPTGVPQLVYSPYRLWPYFDGALGFGGLGLYYNPFWSGYGYSSSYAYGLPWSDPGLSTYGYAPYPLDSQGPTGGLRLKIEPAHAQVFVDGYYAGIVDDFDGHFQHLDLTSGSHHVEVRAPGYQPLEFDISIQLHHTVVYRGTLVPLITR